MRLSLILYGHVARGVWAGISIVVSSSAAIDVFSHFHAGLIIGQNAFVSLCYEEYIRRSLLSPHNIVYSKLLLLLSTFIQRFLGQTWIFL